MSVGNLKNQGNKGNNFPYQLAVLQLLDTINTSVITSSGGTDYETRTTTYEAINAGTGYSIGDIIVRYDIISVPIGTVITTLWFNQTTQAPIAAPLPADLNPVSSPSSVTIIGPVPLPTGAATEATLGTVNTAVTGLNTPATGLAPSMVRSSAVGTVTAGKRSAAIFNAGNANATVLGAILKPGESVSFSADGVRDALAAIAYDGTGTDLLITTVG